MTANRLVTIYTRALAISGPALVVAVLIADPRWTGQLPEALLMLGATIMLRGAQVSLSKYSYLTQTGLIVLAGSLLVGVPAAHAEAWQRACAMKGVRPVQVGEVTAGNSVIVVP